MVPTVELPPAVPATSHITVWLVVPVTVAVNWTAWPTTTEVAVGDTLTEIAALLLLWLVDPLPPQPATHKIPRPVRILPQCLIVALFSVASLRLSMQLLVHRGWGSAE